MINSEEFLEFQNKFTVRQIEVYMRYLASASFRPSGTTSLRFVSKQLTVKLPRCIIILDRADPDLPRYMQYHIDRCEGVWPGTC